MSSNDRKHVSKTMKKITYFFSLISSSYVFFFLIYLSCIFIIAVILNPDKNFFDAVLFGHLQIILISNSGL